MRDAIREHPLALCFLESFVPERSLYWREPIAVRLESGGEVEMEPLAKARFDIMDSGHNLGADIKTAIDASYSGFHPRDRRLRLPHIAPMVHARTARLWL